VIDEIKCLEFRHPQNAYEVHIKDLSTTPGIELPLLSTQVILESESLKEASQIARDDLQFFLDMLSFVTNSKFSIHCLVRVADWTPGLDMRECLQYKGFPATDRPYPFLDESYLKTIDTLLRTDYDNSVKRALKWFGRGISSIYLDDQFQCFWFVIELLAERFKNVERVPDLCQKCRSPLFCESCQETPKHRPYPKQAIQQLISKLVKGEPEKLFQNLSDIRNGIMHGDEIKAIEKRYSLDVAEMVNIVGNVAWMAIFYSFKMRSGSQKVTVIGRSKFTNETATVCVHYSVGCKGDKDNPRIEDLPMGQISMEIQEQKKEAGEYFSDLNEEKNDSCI